MSCSDLELDVIKNRCEYKVERRTAALPSPSASLQRRCWPHRGPRTGTPASLAVPLLTVLNPVFSAVVVTKPHNYNWLMLWF